MQLLSHEVSEMQRWEASFWGGDDTVSTPVSNKADATPGSTRAPLSRDPTPVEAGADSVAASPEAMPSDGDIGVSSPPLLRSPVPAAESRYVDTYPGTSHAYFAV